jgi:hypothetical protein
MVDSPYIRIAIRNTKNEPNPYPLKKPRIKNVTEIRTEVRTAKIA